MVAEACARSSETMLEGAHQRKWKETLGRYATGVTVVAARRGDPLVFLGGACHVARSPEGYQR
ncbi:hypothetical protein [Aquisalimonas sp.]|uniref:hypothetical protein n=1 Tax=Aquisalimonas sp. TaxID=1872621 RepID=UPI0025B7DD5C|nr:hypothetical protein [Aquisalimonas sp.]